MTVSGSERSGLVLHDPALRVYSMDNVQDPYPVIAEIRDATPIAWSESLGSWMAFSYELVRQIYRDHERFSNHDNMRASFDALPANLKESLPLVRMAETTTALNQADPPTHTRHRQAIGRAFSVRSVARLTMWVEDLCARQADVLRRADEPDLVRDYSAPLAYQIILGMFGVPASLGTAFSKAGMARSRFHSLGLDPVAGAREYEQSLHDLNQLLSDIPDEVEDDMPALARHLREDPRLSPDEVFQILRAFFTGGEDNLVYALPVAMSYLLRDPRQAGLIRDDPDLGLGAYEEAIRLQPHNLGNRRIVVDDISVGGEQLRRGDTVLAVRAAANRDPLVWTRPDEFDAQRDQNEPSGGSIAFGQGIHFCVGAGVARLSGATAIRTLLTEFPNLRLPEDWTLRVAPIPGTRKIVDMPVLF